jgi:ribonuclease P protein component
VPARTIGRLQTRAAFRELQRSRSRGSSGPIRATFAPVPDSNAGLYPQVGYAISKACGNAVVRNTLRRRMRETTRTIAPQLPKGLYLLRTTPEAADRPDDQFRADVVKALHRAAGLLVTP